MYSTTISAAICGLEVVTVQVEVDMAQGLPGFMMVGYLGSEVKEAGERVRVALKNSGIAIPPMKITVNLSPAGMKKGGTAFDLAIAVGILQTMGHIQGKDTEGIVIVGELSLNGAVNPVKGVLPLVQRVKEKGFRRCMVPAANQREGAVIPGIGIIGVANLQEAMEYFRSGRGGMAPDSRESGSKESTAPGSQEKNSGESMTADSRNEAYKESAPPDYGEIHGQYAAKRAAEIAAAGFHNLLLIGPPGSGKTMIAKGITGILPRLTGEESLEVSSVYSISGLLNNGKSLISERPFIDPHHTVTAQALTGGGKKVNPGLISLAHKGVLFLDELPEFRQGILDLLRQPLEDRKIRISRVDGDYVFPAEFMLVSAMNPCPCGYYPDLKRCRCTEQSIKRYQGHISGPVLDRIDICAEAAPLSVRELVHTGRAESSEAVRNRVVRAWMRQTERYKGKGYSFNALLPAADIQSFCPLTKREQSFVEKAFGRLGLSARAYYRILRVARTIADIDDSEKIKENHLAEAVALRMSGNKYWEGEDGYNV